MYGPYLPVEMQRYAAEGLSSQLWSNPRGSNMGMAKIDFALEI